MELNDKDEADRAKRLDALKARQARDDEKARLHREMHVQWALEDGRVIEGIIQDVLAILRRYNYQLSDSPFNHRTSFYANGASHIAWLICGGDGKESHYYLLDDGTLIVEKSNEGAAITPATAIEYADDRTRVRLGLLAMAGYGRSSGASAPRSLLMMGNAPRVADKRTRWQKLCDWLFS